MIQQREKSFLRLTPKQVLIALAGFGTFSLLQAQQVPFTDLTYFDKPGASWQIAGDVNADLNKNNLLTSSAGTGILVNLPTEKMHGQDLVSLVQHGDADLEFDFMMAKGSNSGVYLQGRYEIQLLDSWNINRPGYGDNGGIYERWDDARGKGNEGYQGYAPRQNVSMAPGLWQHLKIAFQAPRFNTSGVKTANARMLKIELNGVTIHENVELLGATRGSLGQEVAIGPLRIQGDHGAVAFKNMQLVNYDKQRPAFSNLNYALYNGRFGANTDFKKLTAANSGSNAMLSSNIDTKKAETYLVRYTGNINIKEAGEYKFKLDVPEGTGSLKIDGNPVTTSGNRLPGIVNLPAGDHAIDLQYAKTEDWGKPWLALYIAGPGIREYLASDGTTTMGDNTDPIIADGIATPVLRSFMDLKGFGRLTHAVNVSSPQKVHFTYDMDRGNIAQVWRGGFLDATPMWHDRGDGSSRPLGASRLLGIPAFAIDKLSSATQPWRMDSVGTAYRPTGYALDETDRPVFNYQLFGATVTDAIRVLEQGQGFEREISVENPPGQLYVRLAKAAIIESLGNGLYLVNDKSYYLRLGKDAGNAEIRDVNGSKELIVPIQNKLVYAIIF